MNRRDTQDGKTPYQSNRQSVAPDQQASSSKTTDTEIPIVCSVEPDTVYFVTSVQNSTTSKMPPKKGTNVKRKKKPTKTSIKGAGNIRPQTSGKTVNMNGQKHIFDYFKGIRPPPVQNKQVEESTSKPAVIPNTQERPKIYLASNKLEFLDDIIKNSDVVKHLLNPESQALLKRWLSLDDDSKKIVSHLYWSGSLHLQQLENIKYENKRILSKDNKDNIRNDLLKKGFIRAAPLRVLADQYSNKINKKQKQATLEAFTKRRRFEHGPSGTCDQHPSTSKGNNASTSTQMALERPTNNSNPTSKTTKKQQVNGTNVAATTSTKTVAQAEKNPASSHESEIKWDFKTCIRLLHFTELKKICKSLKLSTPRSKSIAQDILHKHSKKSMFKGNPDNTLRVLKKLREKINMCYKLSDAARSTFHELRVLVHLGILGMNSSEDPKMKISNRPKLISSSDIFTKSYPINKTMQIDNASIIFRDRNEFYRYLEAYSLSESYFTLSQLKRELNGQLKRLDKSDDVEQKEDIKEKITKIRANIAKMEGKLSGYHSILQIPSLVEKAFNVDTVRKKKIEDLPPWLRTFTPESVYSEILEDRVTSPKAGEMQQAVAALDALIQQTLFRQHKKAEWYKEKAFILDKYLSRPDEAIKTLLEAFNSDMSDEAKDVLRRYTKFLASKRTCDMSVRMQLPLELDIEPIEVHQIWSKNLPLPKSKQTGRVMYQVGNATMCAEDYCIQYYTNKEIRMQYFDVKNDEPVDFTNGEHWEGDMMSTIFTLLFWDIIYAKPADAVGIFMSHYQRYPLDMYSKHFYHNRKKIIDERLEAIENSTEEEIIEMMREPYTKNSEYKVSDISASVSWDGAGAVCRCAGARALGAVCRRLARGYGHAYWGFPDVTLWNERTKKIKFLEVKTERDVLSMKQKRWLLYLKKHGIEVAICHIRNPKSDTEIMSTRTPYEANIPNEILDTEDVMDEDNEINDVDYSKDSVHGSDDEDCDEPSEMDHIDSEADNSNDLDVFWSLLYK